MSARRLSFVEQARRALVASLRAAAKAFPTAGGSGSHAVHDARKELKRSASLARGFSSIVGPEAYVAIEAANAARRHYGRTRDLDVLPLALERVKCEPEIRTVLTRAIAIERGAALGATPDASGVADKLGTAADAVAAWDIAALDDSALAAALRQTYKSAKRRGAAAFASQDADDLHELRRGVIDLGHQLEALRPAWPALIDAIGEELRRLRQTLGDFNDLTILGEFALSRRELSAEDAAAFVDAVERRRRPLARKARSLFERVFAERPSAFARRLSAYLAHPQGRD
jgi:CHAD domain-containing protein